MRGRRARVMAAFAVLALACAAPEAWAQRPVRVPPNPPPRPPRPDSLRTRQDTLRARRDTTRLRPDSAAMARDSTSKANLAPPDSVMQRLLSTPGYDARQYQAKSITFDAATRGIELTKNPVVVIDSQIVKTDSLIRYNGSGSAVQVKSTEKGRNVFVTPGQAPIISSGAATYDIASRRASVVNLTTSVAQGGQNLFITGERVALFASGDSVRSVNDATYYLRNGTVTACDDSIPDYYFKASEIKRTGSFVVARPAVLYIGDVPVMWLPFLFQDIRGGRHSGLLVPNFGVSDFVRNSPSYRRSVEGLGYYVAISDYLDAQASFDWRSSAGQSEPGDLGYTRWNGELQYKWIERFVDGQLAFSQTRQGDSRNTAISLRHSEQFTRNSSLNATLNYVTDTRLQRQTTINPYTVTATIRSSATYNHKLGPVQLALGGSRTQYPGRSLVDQTLPQLSLTTTSIGYRDWLVWTPSLSYTSTQQLGVDQASNLGYFLSRHAVTADSAIVLADSGRKRNSYRSSLQFSSPLQILGYQLGNSFSITSERDPYPQWQNVTSVDSGIVTPRIYAETFRTAVDWTPTFTLPAVARNNFNLTPSLSLSNVDGNAFWIRNERTGGRWVHQKKRPTFGLSASPTLFGLFGGFGPFTRLRHSISPTFGYTYAPGVKLSDDYLAAVGATRWSSTSQDQGNYLQELPQQSLSFRLTTNVEAKTRSVNDSNPEAGDKLKLISLDFDGLSYDFERARATHSAIRGLTTQSFGYNATSELLPGFSLRVNYSLFEGATTTDSARFKPFREGISANFSFSNTANPFAVFTRLFGRAVPPSGPRSEGTQPPPDDRYARQLASQPVAGRSAHNATFLPTVSAGWKVSLSFSSSRHRPISGTNVVEFDPTLLCQQYNAPALRLLYDQCVAQQRAAPTQEMSAGSTLPGSTVYRVPDASSLATDASFNITEKWAATYNTSYDFQLRRFAQQMVSLQRDLHDWRAIFAFTQSPNGAFAFNFLISLKAEPDLKFDYHKATYRGQ